MRSIGLSKLASLLLCYLINISIVNCQAGNIIGKVLDESNNQPVGFATITLQGTSYGTNSAQDGSYVLNNVPPGLYNLTISALGYEQQTIFEIAVSGTKSIVQDINLSPVSINLQNVEITAGRFEKSAESPVSKVSIRSSEIMRNPGGNRDISRVLQSFPGVASTVSFRNDIIIRGGAPSENRFYLDGIETPNINHFATQGSSGGPAGMINVNFINQVEMYTSSFPATRGNSLSSVLEFKQKNGNPDRLVSNLMLGSSDIGLTLDGPLGKSSDFIFSVRRSYLQFLFAALKLPFLPTYNDVQYKFNFRLNNKDIISVIGLAALDQFRLNEKVNNGVSDSSTIDRNNYILGYLPTIEQWNYTIGIKYVHFIKKGTQVFMLSRNMLNNNITKYTDNNNGNAQNLIQDYNSREAENKFRFEDTRQTGSWRSVIGVSYELARYDNQTFNKIFTPGGNEVINYQSKIFVHKLALFSQISRNFLNDRLTCSAGLRIDMNSYTSEMANPLNQLSPRISFSYALAPKWYLNLSAGRYYQLPAYTILGFRDTGGTLVNKNVDLKYIRCDHFVGGIEFQPDQNTRITIEAFNKAYDKYPLLIRENISLANLGSDFGVIGNAPIRSDSKGRSRGLEVSLQRTIKNGIYGILAYTYVRSEFTNNNSLFVASSWDNRNLLSITSGKQFAGNWEVGIKFRYFSGAPYTPYDLTASATKTAWDVTRQGILDYSRINSERLPATHQLDVRADKKFYFRKKVLNIYLDIQNIYNYKTKLPPYLTTVNDPSGAPLSNPMDNSKYLLREIPNDAGNLLPSIGIMLEF